MSPTGPVIPSTASDPAAIADVRLAGEVALAAMPKSCTETSLALPARRSALDSSFQRRNRGGRRMAGASERRHDFASAAQATDDDNWLPGGTRGQPLPTPACPLKCDGHVIIFETRCPGTTRRSMRRLRNSQNTCCLMGGRASLPVAADHRRGARSGR